MKAERRHELRENDLAHAMQTARDYLSANAKQLGVFLVAAAAVVTVVSIALGSRAIGREEAWIQLQGLSFATADDARRSAVTLRDIIRDAEDDEFLITGLTTLGSQSLRWCLDVDTPPDAELNDAARYAFEDLLQRFQRDPLAFATAHSGLATVAENDFVLEPLPSHKESARRHLEAIKQNKALASLPFFSAAGSRLERLDETFTVVRFEPAPVVAENTEAGDATDENLVELKPEVQRFRINPDGSSEEIKPPGSP